MSVTRCQWNEEWKKAAKAGYWVDPVSNYCEDYCKNKCAEQLAKEASVHAQTIDEVKK